MSKVGFLCFLVVASAYAATNMGPQKVEVSPSTGGPGVDVEITGPANLVARLKKCTSPQFRGGNNGILLDWGDGTKMPTNAGTIKGDTCRDFLVHGYSRIGKYHLKVLLSHPGPTDGVETEWIGEATISVTPGGK